MPIMKTGPIKLALSNFFVEISAYKPEGEEALSGKTSCPSLSKGVPTPSTSDSYRRDSGFFELKNKQCGTQLGHLQSTPQGNSESSSTYTAESCSAKKTRDSFGLQRSESQFLKENGYTPLSAFKNLQLFSIIGRAPIALANSSLVCQAKRQLLSAHYELEMHRKRLEPGYQEEYCDKIYALLASQEAITAYLQDLLFKKYIDCICSTKIKKGNRFETIKLLLSVSKQNPKITRQDLINIWQLKSKILSSATNSQATASTEEAIQCTLLHKPFPQKYAISILENIVWTATKDAPISKILGKKIPIDWVVYPLHWAAYYGEIPFIEKLIQADMDINEPNKAGATPLFFACLSGRADVISLLISQNAKKDISDDEGVIPAHIAFFRDFGEAFEKVSDIYFDPRGNREHRVLLHYVKKTGRIDIVKALENQVINRFPRSLAWLGKLYSKFLTWRCMFFTPKETDFFNYRDGAFVPNALKSLYK